MLQFLPSGFGKKEINTSLGAMAYYTQTSAPWDIPLRDDLPPILFLHNFGGGASAYEWSKVYPAYAATHQILAPDLIGWGESAHPTRNYRISDYLTTIAEFITQTCRQPVTVVASSLTAALIIRLAITQANLFKKLILVCPSGFQDFGENAGRRLPLSLINLSILEDLIYGLGAENEIAVNNFLESFLFAQPARITPEIVTAYLTSAQKPNAKFAALAFLRGDIYFDLALYIQQLKTPTVILWGEAAKFTPVQLGRRLASLNKNAIQDFVAIAHTGILPHLETPEIFIGLSQKYL